ncbi:MAG: hypothetical protein CMP59_01735 [Flavobacteriales bacterium]|nr:hypothetical protein [Flavobacteriales bacterium]
MILTVACTRTSIEEEKKISRYFNSEIEQIRKDIYMLEIDYRQLNSIDKYYDSSNYLTLNSINSELESIHLEIDKKDYSISRLDSLTNGPLLRLEQGSFSSVFPLQRINNWSDSLNKKMRNLSFLRYKKLILEKLTYKKLGCATLNELQILHFNTNNREYLTFGLLDSLSNKINRIEIKAVFVDDSTEDIGVNVIDRGLYSEIEFLTNKKGTIRWNGFYQVYSVNGETYPIPISGEFEKH